MMLTKQVDSNHYNFTDYVSRERWCSYFEQIKIILGLSWVQTCLEVWSGDSVVASILKKYLHYESLDLDQELNPDHLWTILDNDISQTYDCVCAFQVLEHLPFLSFEENIKKLKELSNKYVLLSLPYTWVSFRWELRPFFNTPLCFKIPIFCRKEYVFDGEHYRDLWYKKTRIKDVKKILSQHFFIRDSYILPNNMYHYFLILEKKC